MIQMCEEGGMMVLVDEGDGGDFVLGGGFGGCGVWYGGEVVVE